MLKSILNAAVNAFRAPPVPEGVIASSVTADKAERMAVSLAISGVHPVMPVTKTARDAFSIEDRVLNPINPLAIAGADPLRASIWWD